MVNDFAGSRRLLAHTFIAPKRPGWMDEVEFDVAISTYKPNSWKGLQHLTAISEGLGWIPGREASSYPTLASPLLDLCVE